MTKKKSFERLTWELHQISVKLVGDLICKTDSFLLHCDGEKGAETFVLATFVLMALFVWKIWLLKWLLVLNDIKFDNFNLVITYMTSVLKKFLNNDCMTYCLMTISLMTISLMKISLMTISLMTISLMTISLMTISLMTISLMTISLMTISLMTISPMTLSLMTINDN